MTIDLNSKEVKTSTIAMADRLNLLSSLTARTIPLSGGINLISNSIILDVVSTTNEQKREKKDIAFLEFLRLISPASKSLFNLSLLSCLY